MSSVSSRDLERDYDGAGRINASGSNSEHKTESESAHDFAHLPRPIALLSCNGDYASSYEQDSLVRAADFTIAVDGGIRHLERMGIQPAIWLGDMDSSVGLEIRQEFLTGVRIDKLPVKKDISDTDYAVDTAIKMGAASIIFIGAIGNRIDHSLFNMNLLLDLNINRKIPSIILDGRQEIRVFASFFPDYVATQKKLNIDASKMIINSKIGKTLSIVPYSDIKSLSLEGFEYPLESIDVSRYSNLTLSNVVLENRAIISLSSGICLIVISEGH